MYGNCSYLFWNNSEPQYAYFQKQWRKAMKSERNSANYSMKFLIIRAIFPLIKNENSNLKIFISTKLAV